MQTHTISRPQWKSTFDSISRIYDGAHASVEVLQDDLGAQFEVEEEPLRGISYDTSGIELHFNTRDGRHLVHRIAHPSQVMVEEDDAGLLAALDIESGDEPRTIVRFQAPRPSRLIGGDGRA